MPISTCTLQRGRIPTSRGPWRFPAAIPPHGASDRKHIMNDPIPPEITTAVAKFLSEGRTGNVTLNIKDGKILGAHVNEIISVKPATRPVAINGEQRRPACHGEKIQN